MTKITKWAITQWLLFIVFIGYFILLNMSPWYYSMSYSRNIVEELESETSNISFKERMLLERELNKMIENEDAYEEDTVRKYRNQGKLNTLDYIFIITLIMAMTYGYGLFLSSLATLAKLLITPTILIIAKTLLIIKDKGYYDLSIPNIAIWWLGYILVIIFLLINDRKLLFVDMD